jgi:hypothetical protein
MKTFIRLGSSALLFAAAMLVFASAVYLAVSEPLRWPSVLIPAAGLLSSALLMAIAFAHPGRPATGCSDTHIQVFLGCLVSEKYERTSYTSSSIIQHYNLTYDLGAFTTYARPDAGFVEEKRICHRCGSEVSLKIYSARASRRSILWIYQLFSMVMFGGWSVFFLIYLAMPANDRVELGIPGLIGVLITLLAAGGWFRHWISTRLQWAADWGGREHRWFNINRRALWDPLQ